MLMLLFILLPSKGRLLIEMTESLHGSISSHIYFVSPSHKMMSFLEIYVFELVICFFANLFRSPRARFCYFPFRPHLIRLGVHRRDSRRAGT